MDGTYTNHFLSRMFDRITDGNTKWYDVIGCISLMSHEFYANDTATNIYSILLQNLLYCTGFAHIKINAAGVFILFHCSTYFILHAWTA